MPSSTLRCVEVWRVPSAEAREFELATRDATFGVGIGLPGRVWASGAPAWIANLAEDPNFPHAAAVSRAGFCERASLYPFGMGMEVLGVMEFFGRENSAPDDHLLQVLRAIGSQFGQFLVRERTEEELRASNQTLRALIQASPLAITAIDLKKAVKIWNPAAERLFGWSEREVIGRPLPSVPRRIATTSRRSDGQCSTRRHFFRSTRGASGRMGR